MIPPRLNDAKPMDPTDLLTISITYQRSTGKIAVRAPMQNDALKNETTKILCQAICTVADYKTSPLLAPTGPIPDLNGGKPN